MNIHLKLTFKIFQKPFNIPNHAILTKDGSCRFAWRDVINNGFDNQNDIEHYPFMNGRFYVNKHIDLFVRRQDPNEYTRLSTGQFPIDMSPNVTEKLKQDNYKKEKDFTC